MTSRGPGLAPAAGAFSDGRGTRPARFVFVGGLHRSGTSLVARLLAGHPQVAGIEGAPVPENEGVYLQGAIPHTARHGRPVHFATDPAQHHVEGGPFDRLEVRDRLLSDWAPWFDAARPWRVEKSPVNLTRMRLYQQLFPTCQFVVVLRHPQVVAQAVAKWVDRPAAAIVDHWIAAHRGVWADLPYLHAVLVLRYEDLVARPDAACGALSGFLGLDTPIRPGDPLRDGNADYGTGTRLRRGQALAMQAWGYGPEASVLPWPQIVRHPLRDIRDRVAAALA